MHRKRALMSVLATISAVALFASPAAAASSGPLKSSCSGSLVRTWNLSDDGVALGRVELWYSTASGGTNCVLTYNTVSGSPFTSIHLFVDDNNDGYVDRVAYDQGNYSSYAGASYLTGTDGNCVQVSGTVHVSSSRTDTYESGWIACG